MLTAVFGMSRLTRLKTLNDSTSRRFAERDRILFKFNPALFEFVAQKRELGYESFKQKTCFNDGGLVLVHRRTFRMQAHLGRVSA